MTVGFCEYRTVYRPDAPRAQPSQRAQREGQGRDIGVAQKSARAVLGRNNAEFRGADNPSLKTILKPNSFFPG